jgi:hypothetical protein
MLFLVILKYLLVIMLFGVNYLLSSKVTVINAFCYEVTLGLFKVAAGLGRLEMSAFDLSILEVNTLHIHWNEILVPGLSAQGRKSTLGIAGQSYACINPKGRLSHQELQPRGYSEVVASPVGTMLKM